MIEDNNREKKITNTGYPFFQIAKALDTQLEHKDPEIRELAAKKIKKWTSVINNLLNGNLQVGSRAPVKDIPEWATLEVMNGGFATGNLLAGGDLREPEKIFLKKLNYSGEEQSARAIINNYYLSEQGINDLQNMLESGCYEINIPEDGALLVIAWLVKNKYIDEAHEILEMISPYFDKLSFYPVISDKPKRFGTKVFLQDVRTTIDILKSIKLNNRLLAQREAINIWMPLYDKTVRLFLETINGDIPSIIDSDNDKVGGSYPCQKYPEGWFKKAQDLLDEYAENRKAHQLCGKPEDSKESFAQLRKYLKQCILDTKSLSGHDVGRIRLLLARYIKKRGLPDSKEWQDFNYKQKRQISSPAFPDIAKVLIDRISIYPKDSGIENIQDVIRPIDETESIKSGIAQATEIPKSLEKKVKRALNGTIDSLVKNEIITSGETLAKILPKLTSSIRANGIEDISLRQLYISIYVAFRNRRSLLLLNLEKQVQINELPWVKVIEGFRTSNFSTKDLARETFKEIALMAITAFPQTIFPNKLIQEFVSLAKTAEIDMTFVEELATDIFMGRFSKKFLRAASNAADLMEGTLYQLYYDIDYQKIKEISKAKNDEDDYSEDQFAEICKVRADVKHERLRPAINGMILEQEQILTTHNLAVLFDKLELINIMQPQMIELAKECFTWVCDTLQIYRDNWHAKLTTLKNTAYAWRQMIFFLSFINEEELKSFISWSEEYFNSQDENFRNIFRPVYNGLKLSAEGYPLSNSIISKENARIFLGWSNKRHWLLGEETESI